MTTIHTLLFRSTLAAISLTGMTLAASAKDTTLTFVSYGGNLQRSAIAAFQEPYTAATGVQFENDTPPDVAKLRAMVEAGSSFWDVMDQGADVAEANCGTLFEELDLSKIDVDQYPEGTVSNCGIPSYFFGLTFVYNTETYKDNAPTKLSDFFDLEQFPGTRVLSPEFGNGIMEYALIADGIEPDQLYPLDIERALAKLDTIKPSIIFAQSNGVLQQALVDGQADMGLAVTGRAVGAATAGAPIAPVWDKTILSWDNWMFPKGTPNKQTARDYIAFISKPEQIKRLTASPDHEKPLASFRQHVG